MPTDWPERSQRLPDNSVAADILVERHVNYKTMNTTLIAGLLSGVVGLLAFLVIHHIWIRPIWFILPAGLVIAGLGGLVIGWAYAEIQAGLPPRPWTSVALFAVIGAILAPSILLAQLRGPLIDISTGAIPPNEVGSVIAHFVGELLLTATVVGGVSGWLLGHTARAVIATTLAGFVFALGPGHNIPLLGSTPAVGKGLVILVIVVLVSALVLVESQAWLARRSF